MSMVSVTFYGGAGEIGGNKVLLESLDTNLFLDFGMSFKKHGDFFSEFLQPRTGNALGDYFTLSLIPEMHGLYRNDFLGHNKMPTSEGPEFDGVLISHAHLDHIGHVNLLHEQMPIYCSRLTKDIARVLDDLGSGSLFDLVKTTRSFSYYLNKKGEMSRIRNCRDDSIKYSPRNYPLSIHKGEFEVGGSSVEMFPVDHSIIGASGYILHMDNKSIGYTGDLRLHGQRPGLTKEYVNSLSNANLDVLLVEGTNIDEKRETSESDVKNEITQLINDAEGKHVFVAFPTRDTDRLMSFYMAAREASRKLAVNFRQAYLLDTLSKSDFLELGRDIVTSSDDHVSIYLKKREYGLIGEEEVELEEKLKDYDKKQRQYVGASNQISWKEVSQHPEDYVLFLDNYSVQELVDIKPVEGSIYIKSQCEPFDPEMEQDWERILNWLNLFGLEIKKAHASGHLYLEDIRDLIEQAGPKLVIPIHTEKPETFREISDTEVLVPEEGRKYEL